MEILPQNKVIAFDFALPADKDLFSSYKGKHVNITYTIKAIADIAKKLDVNKDEQFQVMNTYNNKTVYPGSNISFNK